MRAGSGEVRSLTWPCLQCSWKRWKPRRGRGSCSHSKAPGGGSRGRTGESGRPRPLRRPGPARSPGPRAFSWIFRSTTCAMMLSRMLVMRSSCGKGGVEGRRAQDPLDPQGGLAQPLLPGPQPTVPSTPTPLLTLGRAGVTGAKAICIRSCPKQSLTAVEASSSQREGQGRGPRPARSSAGASVESGVSAKENDGEGFTFLWRLHCPHALPSAPGRACSDLAGIARHRSTRVAPTSHHQPPRWQLPQKRGFPKEGLRAGFWLERGQEAYPRLYLDSFSLG